MQSIVIDVTPTQASEWLQKNTFNRKISTPVVDKYAGDMIRGAWTLNHQGIAFGSDGVLVDGQHRLTAIVKSGVTVKMLVTFGASRTGVDELRPRAQIDVAKFGGLSDWMTREDMQVGKVAAEIFVTQHTTRAFSTTQIVEFCDKHREAIEWVSENFKTRQRGIGQAAVRGAFMVAYYHYDKILLSKMIISLHTGIVSCSAEMSVIRARDMLLSGELSGGRSDRLAAVKKLTRAIHAYCNGEELSKLMPQRELLFNLPEEKQ